MKMLHKRIQLVSLILIFLILNLQSNAIDAFEAVDECCKTGQIFSGRNECHMIPNINNVGIDRINCLLKTTYCCLKYLNENFCTIIGKNIIHSNPIQTYIKNIVKQPDFNYIQNDDGQFVHDEQNQIKIDINEFWSFLQTNYECHLLIDNNDHYYYNQVQSNEAIKKLSHKPMDESFCCVGCMIGFSSVIQRISKWNTIEIINNLLNLDTNDWCSNINNEHINNLFNIVLADEQISSKNKISKLHKHTDFENVNNSGHNNDSDNNANIIKNVSIYSNQNNINPSTYDSAASEICCKETLKIINSSIDWCRLRPSPCAHRCHQSSSEMNENMIKCSCWEGYHLDVDGKNCIDIDECEESTHGCNVAHEVCSNTDGGYQCLPKKRTDDGLLQPNLIGNRDECSSGFYFNHTLNRCKDVDECMEGIHDCNHRYQVCMNLPGSWRCINVGVNECPNGFRRLGPSNEFDTGCRDIDECAEGLNNCDYLNEYCQNQIGTFICEDKSEYLMHKLITRNSSSSIFLAPISAALFKNNTDEEYDDNAPKLLCPKGYHYVRFSGMCEDIDECRIGQHNCDLSWNVCINFPGTYKCRLINANNEKSFNVLNTDHHNHSELDALTSLIEQQKQHHPTAQTVIEIEREKLLNHTLLANIPIVCKDGFLRNEKLNICEDIDECRRTLNPCPMNSFCQNTFGGYECHCKSGFIKNHQRNQCDDIDECEQKLSNCPMSTMRCVNTIGSFECIHQRQQQNRERQRQKNYHNQKYCQSKGQTYDLNEKKCINRSDSNIRINKATFIKNHQITQKNKLSSSDDKVNNDNNNNDQKSDSIHNFNKHNDCKFGERMIDGKCKKVNCGDGFFYNHTEKRCQDTNECLEISPCKIDEKCTNTIGSYRCNRKCNSGYRMNINYNICEDIDECLEHSYTCPVNMICENRLGSYTCECKNGFIKTKNGTCEDIDECKQDKQQLLCDFPEQQQCINTIGSYYCECKDGYERIDNLIDLLDNHDSLINNSKCIDIDECANQTLNKCHHFCQNYIGSYKCSCHSGYKLHFDGFTCIDENECEMFDHNSTLFNNQEYRNVLDDDSDSLFGQQSLPSQSKLCHYKCVNTPGSFRCTCPEGYETINDGSICRDIDECEQRPEICPDNQFCLNVHGSYRCITIACLDGYFFEMKTKKCLRHQEGIMGFRDLSKPISYSFNYLSIVSNLRIPKSLEYIDLVSLDGKVFAIPGVKLSLTLLDAHSTINHKQIRLAKRDNFIIRRPHYDRIIISLIEPIEGPQDVNLELTISLYPDDKFSGMSKAFINIIVSEYEF